MPGGARRAALPARTVPVTAQVGCIAGDGHEVPGTGLDRTVAPGTHVALRRFVGLHAPHLDGTVETVPHSGSRTPCHGVSQPAKAHVTSIAETAIAATTNTMSVRLFTRLR